MKIRTPQNRGEYEERRNRVTELKAEAKEEMWKNIGRDLDRNFENGKNLLYRMAKEYIKANSGRPDTIRHKEGRFFMEREDIDRR